MSPQTDIPDPTAAAHSSLAEVMRFAARCGLFLAPLLLVAGCGGSDNAAIRVLNVSEDYTSVNVCIGSSSPVATVPMRRSPSSS
jgi:hypothetical protein